MSNKSKAKGTAYESMVRDYLKRQLPWLNIDRSALHSQDDIGDIYGVFLPMPHGQKVPVCVECKATPSQPNMRKYLAQTWKETKTLGVGAVGVLTTKLPHYRESHMALQPVITFDCFTFIWQGRHVIPFKQGSLGVGTFNQLKKLTNRAETTGDVYEWRYPRQPKREPNLLVTSLHVFTQMLRQRRAEYKR